MTHLDSRPPVVITLKSDTLGIVTDPTLIVQEFEKFFKDVYTSKVNYPLQDLEMYLVHSHFLN